MLQKLISNLIADIEERFHCIAYAYETPFGSWGKAWCIDVSDYSAYVSKAFKDYVRQFRSKHKEIPSIRIIFAYRSPKEDFLAKLAEENNLIMNI